MIATRYLYAESDVELSRSGHGLSAEPIAKSAFPTMSPFHSAVYDVFPK